MFSAPEESRKAIPTGPGVAEDLSGDALAVYPVHLGAFRGWWNFPDPDCGRRVVSRSKEVFFGTSRSISSVG